MSYWIFHNVLFMYIYLFSVKRLHSIACSWLRRKDSLHLGSLQIADANAIGFSDASQTWRSRAVWFSDELPFHVRKKQFQDCQATSWLPTIIALIGLAYFLHSLFYLPLDKCPPSRWMLIISILSTTNLASGRPVASSASFPTSPYPLPTPPPRRYSPLHSSTHTRLN